MKLAVVVLCWNGADIIEKSIRSLTNQTYKNSKIIVIDNDSQDNSKELLKDLKKEYSEKLHVIYNDKNSGFAGGVNIGIMYALKNNFDAVALFNSDAVADKKWLECLNAALLKKADIGVATGLLLHEDGTTIDSTGDWYSKWGLAFPRNRDEKAEKAEKSSYVFSGSGGASLYRAAMFQDIGLFDEDYFAYYEDIDISFRAQLAGWRVYYTDKAIAYHEQGGSSKKVPGFTVKQTFRNLPLLFIKNVPRKFLLSTGSRLFLAYWLMVFNTVRYGNLSYALRGWIESLLLTPGALKKRGKIQNNKKVTDIYLASLIWQDLPPEQSGLRKFRSLFGGKK